MGTQSALLPPLLLLLLLSLSSPVVCRADDLQEFGGFTDVPDLSDPQVVDAAKFIVDVTNRELSQNGTFLRVLYGLQNLYDGVKYRLVVAEERDGKQAVVGAEVFKELMEHTWTFVHRYLPDMARAPLRRSSAAESRRPTGAAADGGRPRHPGVPAR